MTDATEDRLKRLLEWKRDVEDALRRGTLSRGDQIGYRAQLTRVTRQIAMLTECDTQET